MLFAPRIMLVVAVDDVDGIRRRIGHGATHRLILAVAARLVDAVGTEGSVRAFGGDAFKIARCAIADEAGAHRLASRLHDAARQPLESRGLQYHVSVSIGIASGHGSADALELAAVSAMQRVALNGGDATFAMRVARTTPRLALAS